MFHALVATATKDLKLLARDPGALALLFLMPLIFILVMSAAMSKVFDPKSGRIAVAVADEDHGAFATALVRALTETEGFAVVAETEGQPLERAAAEQLIKARRAQVAVVIPAGLSSRLAGMLSGIRETREIVLIVDPSLSLEVLTPLRGALTGLAQQAALRSLASGGLEQLYAGLEKRGITIPDDVKRSAASGAARLQSMSLALVALREAAPAGMETERRPNSVEQSVPGYTLLGLFFVAMQLAANLFEEKRLGTFRRLLAAPVPRWALMAGKLVAFVSINLVQVGLMFAIGVLALPHLGLPGMSLGRHPEGLVLITVAAALAANSLGLFIAALARTPAQSIGLSLMFILTSSMIGGVMVPRFLMPDLMQKVGWLSPHTWALTAYQDVLMRGADIGAILPQVGMLLGFAAVFFAVGVWRFRWD